MFVLAIGFVFLPPLVFLAIRHIQSRRRRRMVNAPRKIKVLSEADAAERADPCAKGHQRSKRNARQGADGVYVSVCRTCRKPMRRNGPGDWVVVE
jgi:hypothetical protein